MKNYLYIPFGGNKVGISKNSVSIYSSSLLFQVFGMVPVGILSFGE